MLLTSTALAWHGSGHYLVAHIAQTYLQEHNPDALDWANRILAPYTDVCGENFYPFVESASWADKIESQGWNIFDSYHFIKNPWYADGGVPKNFDMESSANIYFAIALNVKTLLSTKIDPYGSSKSILGQSLTLRTLIHFLGDIHQPLHASRRVTADLPDGDFGGELFSIKQYNDPRIDNLHYIWDAMFMPRSADIGTNLSPTKYQTIEKWSKSIQAEYPFETLRPQIEKNDNQKSWANESLSIAQSFAYTGIVEGSELPQVYQDKGRQICRERVALAGYRLAITLDMIYKKVSGQGNPINKGYLDGLVSFMGPLEYRIKVMENGAEQVRE